MILARIFTKIYKKSGIILIDSKGQKYICGNPRKDKPITINLLKENLKWKLLVNPELEFPEAYMRGEIIIENASLKDFLMDLISQYNYRLEDRGIQGLDKMTKKEEEQCMEQIKKQADRIAKLFGFDKHWIT